MAHKKCLKLSKVEFCNICDYILFMQMTALLECINGEVKPPSTYNGEGGANPYSSPGRYAYDQIHRGPGGIVNNRTFLTALLEYFNVRMI